jgi:hypothetical protein
MAEAVAEELSTTAPLAALSDSALTALSTFDDSHRSSHPNSADEPDSIPEAAESTRAASVEQTRQAATGSDLVFDAEPQSLRYANESEGGADWALAQKVLGTLTPGNRIELTVRLISPHSPLYQLIQCHRVALL